jgi:hypothetical protein
VTRLRKMMLEELQRRYVEITTRKYLQWVTALATLASRQISSDRVSAFS